MHDTEYDERRTEGKGVDGRFSLFRLSIVQLLSPRNGAEPEVRAAGEDVAPKVRGRADQLFQA